MSLDCLIKISYLSKMYNKFRGDVTLIFNTDSVSLMAGDNENNKIVIPAKILNNYKCTIPCEFTINQFILDPFYNAIECGDSNGDEEYFHFTYDSVKHQWSMDYE